jgi:WD repeat-containing protein 48
MAPGKPSRRVSYVIPEPILRPPRLRLPHLGADRHGSTTPLLIPLQHDGAETPSRPLTAVNTPTSQPRHRLGVNSLALDTSTQLEGRETPEGILYSGGRDGMIIAHEIGIIHKRRAHMAAADLHHRRWETLVGFPHPHDEPDQEPGQVKIEEIPYVNAWEMDTTRFEPGHVRAACAGPALTHSSTGSQLCSDNQYRLTRIG